MDKKKQALDGISIKRIITRLSHEIVEKNHGTSEITLVGIQTRGEPLAKRLQSLIHKHSNIKVSLGFVDISFYRDDFRRGDKKLEANKTEIDFVVEDKKVVFIDDVLYTGRSIRAALTAIQSFGRPSEIELLTLIDRRFSRHLPIQPDYRGRQVDAINNERVIVKWKENEGEDLVLIEVIK